MPALNYEDKLSGLLDLYSHLSISQAVVFVKKKEMVEKLTDELTRENHTVSMLHGDMEADDRELVRVECGVKFLQTSKMC